MTAQASPASVPKRPAMPGVPYMLELPRSRKIGYCISALTIALLGTLGNALIATNLGNVAGEYGVYVAEATWLTAVFSGMGASAALFVVKGRMQFGIDPILKGLLVFYALASLLAFLFPGLSTALIARCANGLATSTGAAAAVYYLLEVLPGKRKPAAILIVLGTIQMATPIARLFPVELLTSDGNRGLHLINLAIPLIELAVILAWPMPRPLLANVLERFDSVLVALLMPAIILVAAVLALGRVLWWVDTPWLGWMLVAAVPLLTAAVILELGRYRPMIWFDWLSRGDILRLLAIAIVERLVVAEQNVGAVGLVSAAGLNNDQLHGLFAVVIVAMALGIVAAVLTLGEKAIPFQAIAALSLIAIGAAIDAGGNGLTRPSELLVSQALIGFGTTLFVGPALLFGVLRVLKTRPHYLVSLILVFGLSQNLGSVAGSAVLASYQYIHSREHDSGYRDGLRASSPIVSARIGAGAAAARSLTTDPAVQMRAGSAALDSSITGQANVRSYLDVFQLVALIAAICALSIGAAALLIRMHSSKQLKPQS